MRLKGTTAFGDKIDINITDFEQLEGHYGKHSLVLEVPIARVFKYDKAYKNLFHACQRSLIDIKFV